MHDKLIKFASYFFLLTKYSHTEALLAAISGQSQEIRDYILNLDSSLQGFAVGTIKKNPGIDINNLGLKVSEFHNKLKLKENTMNDIAGSLPADLDPSIKGWTIIQIRKYPNHKDAIIKNIVQIASYVISNGINISNYTYESIMKEMSAIKLETAMPMDLKMFFDKITSLEQSKILGLEDDTLKKWFTHHLNKLRLAWIKNVLSSDNLTGLLPSFKELSERRDRGEFRGQEIPAHPLYDSKYNQLYEKIGDIKDWYASEHPDINQMSPLTVLEKSKNWHLMMAQQSGKYSPISRENIFYGPEGWADEQNNGYFFVELKLEGDLKQEGNLMSHCVGGYCESVDSGNSRIFSLRNVNNPYVPIITVETDGSTKMVRQDYGPDNSKIDEKYHEMVREAFVRDVTIEDFKKMRQADRQTDQINVIDDKSTSKEMLTKIYQIVKLDYKQPGDPHVDYYTNDLIFNLAQKPNLDFKIMEDIYQSYNGQFNIALSQNPNLPTYIIEDMINNILKSDVDDSLSYLIGLITNPNITPDILETLSKHDNVNIKWYVSINEKTKPETLVELFKTGDPQTLEGVAQNKNTPPEILTELSEGYVPYITIEVCKNPNTPAETLKNMMGSGNKNTIREIAKNTNLDYLEFEKLSKSLDYVIRQNIAENKGTPINILEVLSKDEFSSVRGNVAKNLATPPHVLAELSKDIEHWVRLNISYNENTPTEILTELTKDNDESVREAANNTLNRRR